MKIIKLLSEMIEEEIEDACKYVREAIKYRDQYPEISRLFGSLSSEEMDHMRRLHDAVADMINEYRRDRGEPPSEMMAIYDYLHERHVKKAAEVRELQAMFREG